MTTAEKINVSVGSASFNTVVGAETVRLSLSGVATRKVFCLSRQNTSFIAIYFCHDKYLSFVATSFLLSRLTPLLSRQKRYLWQLPPMTVGVGATLYNYGLGDAWWWWEEEGGDWFPLCRCRKGFVLSLMM